MSPSGTRRPLSRPHGAHDFDNDLASFSAAAFQPHLKDGT